MEIVSKNADEIRRRFRLRELALFGSVARREESPSSDVDVLVTFEGAADFDRFMELKFFLQNLLDRKVDLITRKALRPELRSRIEEELVHVA
ncbi:MAG: nucleotidyltransferase family protein [Pirellulales bacterium]|nr:nucleotidyltransferase family protein [Pirellulales bacterium]